MSQRILTAALTLSTVALVGCRDTTLVPPRSLDSPSAMAVARGNVCLTTFEDADRVVQYEISPCEGDERGAIALITNEQSDRLALMDLNSALPRLVDLDPTTPGPNHLEVGRLPVDVAASPDGTIAYTLNQLDRDVSIVDLYTPQVLPGRFNVDETPIAMDVDPATGEVIVAAGSPSRLYGFEGISYCGPGEPCADSPEPADVAPRTLDLPGTVSGISFDPARSELWIVYRDLAYASVVSFAAEDAGDTSCLSGDDSKPCVVANVSLTYGCSDGLDNDGDGLVDQQDVQCYGPRGAESPDGIGRQLIDACANGIDDDEDGLTDRDDPECAFASGLDEGVSPFAEPPQTACSDDADNDDDGSVDYPNDLSCYGGVGRAETTISPRGFDAIGVDTHGVFVYVADRSGEQVVVVDARRKQLIDGPAAELPTADAFDISLGVDVAPSPLSIQGAIERSIVWVDPDDSDHAIVRYDFGAWASANNGTIQYVDGVVSFCEVTGELVDNEEFWRGGQSDAESRCLELPSFPLQTGTARAVAGDETLYDEGEFGCLSDDFVACAQCIESGEVVCEPCAQFAETQFELCQRAFVTDDLTTFVNPRFALRDGGGDDGRLLGSGTCEQPDELLDAMRAFATENTTGPQDLKCDSLLMPQPLQPAGIGLALDDVEELVDLDRADLFELRTLQFDTDASNAPVVGVRPYDQRIVTEAVTTTYEGVIPGTERADGLFASEAEEDGSIWVDVGFNPCSRGVVPGDRFILTGTPLDDCNVAEDLEYEIVEVTSSEIRIAPVDGFADEVPTRSCFDVGFNYQVRASGEWIVIGETAGFLSPFEAVLDQCVPRYGASRVTSRVRTGELYEGPYYSFYMYPGYGFEGVEDGEDRILEVLPVRDTSSTFQVTSGFSSVVFPTCSSLGQQCAPGLFPAQVLWVPGLPGGTLLLAPDPNDEFIHVRNLDDAAGGYTVVR